MNRSDLPPHARIGHVHLRVADLDRSVGFYHDVLDSWSDTPRGRLALIIVLDQFSRSVYKGTPQAFAQDPATLRLSREGVEAGMDSGMEPAERLFFMLPLSHAEGPDLPEQAERVARLAGEQAELAPAHLKPMYEFSLAQAKGHRDVIARFGRHPHRNAVLGRATTPEESEYLKNEVPVHTRRPPSEEEEHPMKAKESNVFIGPDDGVRLPALDMVHKVTAEASGGSLTVEEWGLSPGQMIPPHTHSREDECNFVLEGELTCDVGGEVVVAQAGSYVLKPRGLPHALYNAGPGPLRVLEILTPGGLEGYFDEYEQIASSEMDEDERRMARAELGERYGITWHDERIPEARARFGIGDRDDGSLG